MYASKAKECYKVENLIKKTPFKLHHIDQHRCKLRTPSNI